MKNIKYVGKYFFTGKRKAKIPVAKINKTFPVKIFPEMFFKNSCRFGFMWYILKINKNTIIVVSELVKLRTRPCSNSFLGLSL